MCSCIPATISETSCACGNPEETDREEDELVKLLRGSRLSPRKFNFSSFGFPGQFWMRK